MFKRKKFFAKVPLFLKHLQIKIIKKAPELGAKVSLYFNVNLFQ